jgi:hypothetical protein
MGGREQGKAIAEAGQRVSRGVGGGGEAPRPGVGASLPQGAAASRTAWPAAAALLDENVDSGIKLSGDS